MRFAIITDTGLRGLKRKNAHESRIQVKAMRQWRATGLLTRKTVSGMLVIQDSVNRG